jgi:hypothetical protein
MNNFAKKGKWLGMLSLLGGVIALPLITAFALTGWGEPGTAAYQTYESLNRLTSIALLLMISGWLGLVVVIQPGYGRWGAILALVGSVAMLIGSAAEFWLFTDQPYGDPDNLRSASWMAFSLGSLVMDVGATLAGVALWRARTRPRWIAPILLLALPLDIVAFFVISPFLGPAAMAVALGWWLIQKPDLTRDHLNLVAPS